MKKRTRILLIALTALALSSCQKKPDACFTVETANISFIGMAVADRRTFQNCSTEASAYEWDFGDNSSASRLTAPDHTYAAVGTYTVTMTAFSDNGRKESETMETVVVSGRAVFHAATQYPITVTIGTQTRTGSPNIVYNDCHSAITFDMLPKGTYSYSATEQSPGTGAWSGSFTITGTGCTEIDL